VSGGSPALFNKSLAGIPFPPAAGHFNPPYVGYRTATKINFWIYLERESLEVASWKVGVSSSTKLHLKNDWRAMPVALETMPRCYRPAANATI
jgi:hypothetical protein